MKKGKLIVIEGTDGAGKATQAALLEKYLKKQRHKVKKIDFPQYYNNFFGKLVGECLAGTYGDFIALDPHIASVLYAADRYESSVKIRKWLNEGQIVLIDRYVSSNQIHQGSKIADMEQRKSFLKWLEKMEYGTLGIPKPDLIVYLDVPIEVTQKLLDGKDMIAKKKYLKGKKDVAESNREHLEKSRQNAMAIVEKMNKWIKIDCAPKGELLSKEDIHQKVYTKVNKILA